MPRSHKTLLPVLFHCISRRLWTCDFLIHTFEIVYIYCTAAYWSRTMSTISSSIMSYRCFSWCRLLRLVHHDQPSPTRETGTVAICSNGTGMRATSYQSHNLHSDWVGRPHFGLGVIQGISRSLNV